MHRLTTIFQIPGLSPLTPITSVLPLVFVITVTMIKQGFEDRKRHQADDEINMRIAHVLHADGAYHDTPYQDLVCLHDELAVFRLT